MLLKCSSRTLVGVIQCSELHRTLSLQEQERETATPLLILANKQDLAMAITERQVVNSLALRQLGRQQLAEARQSASIQQPAEG